MKTKPILFSTPMVQAILEGRKTMTRRVIKFPKGWIAENNSLDWAELHYYYPKWGCKYSVGDILYVRETFENYQGGYNFKADKFGLLGEKWKPSLFMPKEAARIFLKINYIGAERLQDISEEDAIKEGCIYGKGNGEIDYSVGDKHFPTLWAKINGEQSWIDNPFVWVISFERIEKTENF